MVRDNSMTQEIVDFEFFKKNQLLNVDFSTGQIDAKSINRWNQQRDHLNVGHTNQDGYIRLYCNRRLRMKHRLLFWLYHGYLPEEVDHKDKVRDHNMIENLFASDRPQNTTEKTPRKYSHLTEEEVHQLCRDLAVEPVNITQLSKKYGRSRVQIKAILSKKYWSKISDQYF